MRRHGEKAVASPPAVGLDVPRDPQLLSALRAAACPVLVLDRDGRILLFNRACEAGSGIPEERARGRRLRDLAVDVRGGWRSDASSRAAETRWRSTAGRSRRIEWTIAAPGDGRFLWVGRDVTELRRLERGLLDAAEGERRRLGQDLHDGLGQDLTAVALACRALESRLGGRPEEARALFRRLDDCVGRAIRRAREVARGLCPVGLSARGLGALVREAASRAQELSGVRCRVEWAPGEGVGGEPDARHLFGIIQEALTNALRHGRPRRVWIRARKAGPALRVTVRDDGRGFAASGGGTRGIGLLVMKSRAKALGGDLRVSRGARGGVLVECRVPLRAAGAGVDA